MSGTTQNTEYHFQNTFPPYEIENGLSTRLYPNYVSPAPAMFKVPSNCPDAVREHLTAALSLFWVDDQACAGKLRAALEALMDHLGVARTRLDKAKRKRRRIDLHQRIELFRKKAPAVVDVLLAAKWIGNAGAHADEVTKSDVFDAMDLIEYALEETVAKRTRTLAKVAKTISAKKRPRGAS